MAKYVALLRGINVGGNNKIEMPKLKTTFESIGYINVTTYINSGNVIFETRKSDVQKIVNEIEQIITKTFALQIPVLVRDQENIKRICDQTPSDWMNNKDHRTDVMFLWDEYANKNSLNLISTNPIVDTLLYVEGAIIWHLKKKDHKKSKMGDIIGTKVYKNMTVRNINTVRKLNSLFGE